MEYRIIKYYIFKNKKNEIMEEIILRNSAKEELETIEDEVVKENALRNMEVPGNSRKKSLNEALLHAFPWGSTPEGFNYWSDFVRTIKQ